MLRKTTSHRVQLAVTVLLAALILAPAFARAEEGSVADQIKALILEGNDYATQNKMDQEGGVSADGALQFWSSGGLMQSVTNGPPTEYESVSIRAKHIQVIELPGGEAAVAMYYSEGGMHVKGSAPIAHYMTRATEIYVKEDGKWVVRASHWSPIAAGAGTNQTSVD